MLLRTKVGVALELPAKTEKVFHFYVFNCQRLSFQVLLCNLSEEQRLAYLEVIHSKEVKDFFVFCFFYTRFNCPPVAFRFGRKNTGIFSYKFTPVTVFPPVRQLITSTIRCF